MQGPEKGAHQAGGHRCRWAGWGGELNLGLTGAQHVLVRDGSMKLALRTDIYSHKVLKCGHHDKVLKDIVVSRNGSPYGKRDFAEVIKDLEMRSDPGLSRWTLNMRGRQRGLRQ